MAIELNPARLRELLFSAEQLNAYALLDGAVMPDLPTSLYQYEAPNECLYRGEIDPELASYAPYLVPLTAEAPFTEYVLEGWGQHWGVFALSTADLRTLRTHFRKFLMVHDPEGQPLYFRYYDPRVLRVFLPTCTAAELDTVFGPVARYVLEDEDPANAVRFWRENDELQSGRSAVAKT